MASYGLIARENASLPLVVEQIYQDWGLDSTGRFARNLRLHWEEFHGLDIVMAATSFIAEEVRAMGFLGEILDLEVQARSLGIEVIDPQLMPRRQCAFELAKYLKVAVSAFQQMGIIEKGSRIIAFLPENEKAIARAITTATESELFDSSVILADLIAPLGPTSLKFTTPVARFKANEEITSFIEESSQRGLIYAPTSASTHPARVYLSKSWQDFILRSSASTIFIVTPPLRNTTGAIAESYLAALYADEIQLIRS